jgi:hypothetical protein
MGGGTAGELKAIGDTGNKAWGGSILKHPFTGDYYWIGEKIHNSCSINNFVKSARCAVWKSPVANGPGGPYNLVRYISSTVSGVPTDADTDWCHSAKAVFEKKAQSPTDNTIIEVSLVVYAMTIGNPNDPTMGGLNDCTPSSSNFYPRYSNDAMLTAAQKNENHLSNESWGSNDKRLTVFYVPFGTANPTSNQYTAAFETTMWSKLVLVNGAYPKFNSSDKIAGWSTGASPLADTNTWSRWITNPSPLYSAVNQDFPFTYIGGGDNITPGWQKLVLVRSQDSTGTQFLSVLALTATKFIWENGARFYQGPKLQANNGAGGAYAVINDEDPFFFQNDLGYHIIAHSKNGPYCTVGVLDTCGSKYRLQLSTSPYVDANRLVGNNGWKLVKNPNGQNLYGPTIKYNTSSSVDATLIQRPSIYFQNGYAEILLQAVALPGAVGTTSNMIWSHNILRHFINNGNPSGPLTFPQYTG